MKIEPRNCKRSDLEWNRTDPFFISKICFYCMYTIDFMLYKKQKFSCTKNAWAKEYDGLVFSHPNFEVFLCVDDFHKKRVKSSFGTQNSYVSLLQLLFFQFLVLVFVFQFFSPYASSLTNKTFVSSQLHLQPATLSISLK
jgi:hypothetical protein